MHQDKDLSAKFESYQCEEVNTGALGNEKLVIKSLGKVYAVPL